MGVYIKFAVGILILALSVNALDNETLVSTESTVSDDVEVVPDDVIEANTKDVELIENKEQLEVKSGKYQSMDGSLINDTPIDLQAVDFGSSDVQNERQVINSPSTTSITNTEYGKF